LAHVSNPTVAAQLAAPLAAVSTVTCCDAIAPAALAPVNSSKAAVTTCKSNTHLQQPPPPPRSGHAAQVQHSQSPPQSAIPHSTAAPP
jgi:hypothetical protein